jgi:hypothetical protein
MDNTNYWYFGCLRHYILCTLRLFQNFCISEGKNEEGNDILRRVPCVYMTTDKSVAYMLNNATDTVLQSCPKMILALSDVKLNNNKISGAPYFAHETSITEKKFNKETGQYEYIPGNSYNITRLNPLPVGLVFKLDILTSTQDQKFQLFEQIRPLFSPTLELQTSENPLDWSRVTAITLTGLHWSSKGFDNLDGSTLDAMDMTFDVDINLDMPAIVQKEQLIEQITTSIGGGKNLDDIMSWSLEDITQTFFTPTNNRIISYVENDKQLLKLEKSASCDNWYQLLNVFGISLSESNNIKISATSNSNVDRTSNIIGNIKISDSNPTIAEWFISENSLPSTNIRAIDDIITPNTFIPSDIIGTRYLIDDNLTNFKNWGSFVYEDGTPSNENIVDGSIIELTQNGWIVSLNPIKNVGVYYLRNNNDPMKLYTFNNDHKIWVDVVNKTYPVGFWKISSRTV